MKTTTKPIARIDEQYVNDRWVLCTVHFGWHHERATCENPRDDSNEQHGNSEEDEQ